MQNQLVVPISFPKLGDCAYITTECPKTQKGQCVPKISEKLHFEIRHDAM